MEHYSERTAVPRVGELRWCRELGSPDSVSVFHAFRDPYRFTLCGLKANHESHLSLNSGHVPCRACVEENMWIDCAIEELRKEICALFYRTSGGV